MGARLLPYSQIHFQDEIKMMYQANKKHCCLLQMIVWNATTLSTVDVGCSHPRLRPVQQKYSVNLMCHLMFSNSHIYKVKRNRWDFNNVFCLTQSIQNVIFLTCNPYEQTINEIFTFLFYTQSLNSAEDFIFISPLNLDANFSQK